MDSPRLELIALQGSDEVGRWSLGPGVFTVGRSPACSISLPGDGVDEEHARLRVEESGEVFLEPAQAAVSVDGNSIREPVRVLPEQYIDVGTVSLLLESGTSSVDLAPETGTDEEGLPAEFQAADRYAVGSQIAQGGMGAILQARQVAARRTIAMKVILEGAEEDARQRFRFIEEAQITSQLEHPNIVPIYDVGLNAEGRLYYTMKLVKGITLKKILELLKKSEHGAVAKYPLSALLVIFNKVCDALAFAHAKGVIHRDLKPENIMVGSYGEVLLMDWGLAKLIHSRLPELGAPALAAPPCEGESVVSARFEQGDAFATMAGALVGTPAYMSPEQARGELARLDARSDIFSLGIILYELLTLERPFKGKKAQEIMELIAVGEPPDATPFRPRKAAEAVTQLPHLPAHQIPESLAAVARKALAADATQRYPEVKQLQADLVAYQNGFATKAERAGSWKLLKLFIRRNRTLTAAAAVLLLVILGFTAKLLVDRGRILAERNHAEHEKDRAENEKTRAENALLSLRKTIPAFLEQAADFTKQQKYDVALERVEAALSIQPTAPVYRLEGDLLQIQERFDEAAAAYGAALRLDPKTPFAQEDVALTERLASAKRANGSIPAAELGDWYRALHAQGREAEALTVGPRIDLAEKDLIPLWQAKLNAWLGKSAPTLRRNDGLLYLVLSRLPISDLEPIRGMPIENLSIGDTKVRDLAPLKGMPLRSLTISHCQVTDLSPLAGMPITRLYVEYVTGVTDWAILRSLPLEALTVGGGGLIDLRVLTGLKLKIFHAQILDSLEGLQGNPLEDLSVVSLRSLDLTPLRGMPLRKLRLENWPGKDLLPLKGMPLEILQLGQTSVGDLSPLAGAPLRYLTLSSHSAPDVAPLAKCLELESLILSPNSKSIEVLRGHPKLKWLSYKRHPIEDRADHTVAEFWAEYDAQKASGGK